MGWTDWKGRIKNPTLFVEQVGHHRESSGTGQRCLSEFIAVHPVWKIAL
jgi:hypothetical protein